MQFFNRLLSSERGEVGDEETAFPHEVTNHPTDAPEIEQGNPEVDPFAVREPTTPEMDSPEGTQGQEQVESTFLDGDKSNLDPRTLPPELQPIFKNMQAAYTRRFQELNQIRDKAQAVDRFFSDPQYAYATLSQWAQQNGYTLAPANAQGKPQGSQQGDVPAYLVEAMKQNLGPELEWLAEPQAKAMYSAFQGMLMPLLQQQQAQRQQQLTQQWDGLASELSNLAPGWEQHESEMGDLFDYLSDRTQLTHPKYGSKLQLLYDLATKNSATLKQVQKRVQSAATNRVTSGRTTGNRAPSIENEIAKAGSTQDAWALAVKHARSQHPGVS